GKQAAVLVERDSRSLLGAALEQGRTASVHAGEDTRRRDAVPFRRPASRSGSMAPAATIESDALRYARMWRTIVSAITVFSPSRYQETADDAIRPAVPARRRGARRSLTRREGRR